MFYTQLQAANASLKQTAHNQLINKFVVFILITKNLNSEEYIIKLEFQCIHIQGANVYMSTWEKSIEKYVLIHWSDILDAKKSGLNVPAPVNPKCIKGFQQGHNYSTTSYRSQAGLDFPPEEADVPSWIQEMTQAQGSKIVSTFE